jgi:hypothetical protein
MQLTWENHGCPNSLCLNDQQQDGPLHPFPESGFKYEGQQDDHNVWQGQGRLTWGAFYFYEGQFRDGKAHGFGEYVGENGNRYAGAWQYGHAHGYGQEVQLQGCASSRTYNGEWEADRRHGQGAEVYGMQCDLQRYEGEFHQGLRHDSSSSCGSPDKNACPWSWQLQREYCENEPPKEHLEDRTRVAADFDLGNASFPSGKQPHQRWTQPLEETRGMIFTVQVTRPSGRAIGVELDFVEGDCVVIAEFTPGTFKDWNEANPSSAVQEHDRILQVNGVRLVRELVGKLKEDSTWKLSIQRPMSFTVVVRKGGATSLGLELRHAANGKSLLITKLSEGPLSVWNAANPDLKVKPGDRIVGLNGVQGRADKLLEYSKTASTLTMKIIRYSPRYLAM